MTDQIIRITFSDKSICYVAGFQHNGDVEITTVPESASRFGDWDVDTVIRNAKNNMAYHDKFVVVEAINPGK